MIVLLFVELAILSMMSIVPLTIGILFLLSLQKTLDRCLQTNRTMEPTQVWLCLIPLFNLGWIVRVVFAVGDSLRNEYDDRNLDRRGDFGKTIGVCWLATTLLCVVIWFSPRYPDIPILDIAWYLFHIAALAFFIVYWVRIVSYRRQLERDIDRDIDRDDDRDFEDDDRPRRPARPDDRIR